MGEQRSVFAKIRTVIVVTLISMMLWLLAESRMVRSQTVEAQLAITMVESPGGIELAVRQEPGQGLVRVVEIEIEGSTSGIDELVRQLQNRVELRLGREIPARPGVFEIDLRAELRKSPDLDMHGVTITAVNPERVTVEVDEIETREYRIGVGLPEGVQTDSVPFTEPALVTLRAPSSVMQQVASEQAKVVVTDDQVEKLTPGRLETVPGMVVELDGVRSGTWATTLEPAQVDVLVTLRSVTQRLTLDPLPVQVLLAPGEIGRWRVDLDDTDRDLLGVEIEGPVDAIELLRSKSVRPRALIALSFEDLGQGINEKPAQIVNLPPGCRVVSQEQDVGFRISRVAESSLEQDDAGSDQP